MFELQNNRGRDLTNMEKLKSYFMYQMYVESPSEETAANVEQIANYFKDIYKTIYDKKMYQKTASSYITALHT